MDGLNKFIYEIGSDSAFSILARSNELIKQGKEVINLGIGQPDFPTAPNIVESAVKALREGNHGYSSSNGILELREAVADDFFNRNNVKIDPNNILITVSRIEFLESCCFYETVEIPSVRYNFALFLLWVCRAYERFL